MTSQIKPDPDASTSYIKPELDRKEVPATTIDDDDIYEDAGDLDFSDAARSLWLSRIPRALWEHWSKLDEDEEIELGTVRIEGDLSDIKRVSLRIRQHPGNRDIPKDYILQRQTINTETAANLTSNTYLFTEKDLPGHENRLVIFGEARSALYESVKREARKRDRGKRWEPYARKTIPKQTGIAGRVNEEFNCLPVENEEFRRISEKRALDALRPKRETVFVEKIPGQILQARHALPSDKGAFVQTAKPVKVRAQENKTTRMPQNELLDLIYQCFREYKYWPFKTLKAKLRQPEAYLKQTLEMVARLVKAGDFAMTWELKPEARESSYANAMAYGNAKEELPPGTEYSFDDASEDDPTMSGVATDNDDAQFETVL